MSNRCIKRETGETGEKRETHLRLGHPDGAALLQIDRVTQFAIPGLLIIEGNLCAKDVRPDTIQFLALLQQFLGALVRRLGQSMSQLFDHMLAVGLQEYDNGIELCIVETIHRIGCDVQQGMFAPIHNVADVRQSNNATFAASICAAIAIAIPIAIAISSAGLVVVLQRSAELVGIVFGEFLPGQIGDGSEEHEGTHEAGMTQHNALVGGELGNAVREDDIVPVLTREALGATMRGAVNEQINGYEGNS